MASDKNARLCVVTMGKWYTGIGGTTRCGSYTRYNLEGDIFTHQALDFFTASTKDEWISTLESQYPFSFVRQFNQ
tara:strand:- start:213 stop:437 length:225 start_codon:yes stop_codon:yes gene_type:complete